MVVVDLVVKKHLLCTGLSEILLEEKGIENFVSTATNTLHSASL